jgi:hypothetical protein
MQGSKWFLVLPPVSFQRIDYKWDKFPALVSCRVKEPASFLRLAIIFTAASEKRCSK